MSRNRKLFLAVSMATIASLISLLVIVPLAFGDRFVSCSFSLLPIVGRGARTALAVTPTQITLPFWTSWETQVVRQPIGRENVVDYWKDFHGAELRSFDNEVAPPNVSGYDFGLRQLKAAGCFDSTNSYCYFSLFDMTPDSVYNPPFKIKPHTFINIWYCHMNLANCMIDAQICNVRTGQYQNLRDFSWGSKFIVDQKGTRIHPAYRCSDIIGSWQFACFDLSIIYDSDPGNWYVTKIWIGFDNRVDHETGYARTYFDHLYISYAIRNKQTCTTDKDNATTSGSIGPWDYNGFYLVLKVTISGFDDGYWEDIRGRHEICPYILKVNTDFPNAQLKTWPKLTGRHLREVRVRTLRVASFLADWGIFSECPCQDAQGEVYILISGLSRNQSYSIPITFTVDYYWPYMEPHSGLCIPKYYETVSLNLSFEWTGNPDSVNLPPPPSDITL